MQRAEPGSRNPSNVEVLRLNLSCQFRVFIADLIVQRNHVVEDAEEEQSARAQIDDAGKPLSKVKTVNSKCTQESQENPAEIVINGAGDIPEVGFSVHGWDQEKVDDPTDQKYAACEKPDCPGNWTTVIKPMGSQESEDPEKVADCFEVRVLDCGRVLIHRFCLRHE